jgi:outer membrane receptor protein involved in Fe transport
MEKPMTRNVQKTLGIRVALLAAVAFPLIIATSARAQDATAPAPATTGTNIAPNGAPTQGAAEATAERVVVTGSNIPTAEEVGPNPVDTYRRDDITRLGVRTPTDLVLRIPASTGSNTTENNTNGGDGSTRISLRGIDPKETLVLQDGRRLAYAGTSSIDFNQFPLGLIDHIDILKDGASPIYGTEAVAGVVNVFLIHRFRGLEVYGSYGNTNMGFAGDHGEETAYLLAGTGDDKTDIVVYAGIYNAAAIYSRDVNISHDPDKSAYGSFDVRSGNLAGRVTSRYFLGLAKAPFKLNLRTPTPHAAANQLTDTQYTSAGAASLVNNTIGPITSERFLFNFADLTPDIAATDREYLYGSVIRDICDKYLTVFADFKYFRQFWDGGLAPAPFTPDVWTDVNKPFGISTSGISVPTQNAFNPFTVGDYTSPGGFTSATPLFSIQSAAPAGTVFTTGVRYRSVEAGLRTVKIQTNNYAFTGGLKGNLGEFANAWDQLKTWEWEFGFRYNESNRVANTGGIVNNNALRTFLLDTDPATAFNPFGKNANNKAVLNQVMTTTHDVEESVIMTEDFAVRGDMFNLPGGAVRFAIGGAHLGNTFHDQPDPLTVTGQTTGSTNGQATKGNRDTWSIFWEARVPVTGPTWNFPGAYSLEFGYAERFESYSDFGQTERPKFDVRWQPIDQSLTLRAAYIEAFHAPSLFELFGGTTQSFPAVKDVNFPGSGTEAQVEQHIQGNPTLKPEIAYEYTYGGVLTPGKWWAPLQGLTLSADFIHIDIRSFTTFLDAQTLINNERIFPAQVIRGAPNPGQVAGPIILLLTPEQNLGREVLSAWDFEVVEIFETNRLGHGDWGTFTATWNETYMADVDVQFIPNGKRHTAVGKFGGGFQGTNGGGSFTHNRWYASLFYDGPSGSWMQGIDGGFVVHYIGQYWDAPSLVPDVHGPGHPGFKTGNLVGHFDSQTRKVREWVTLDLIVNYTFNLPPPAAQSEVAGYSKDGGKNVKMAGKDKNVMPVSTAEYNPCGWRAWLNNTTLTFGIDNLFDLEPPFVAGAFENGYDESTTNAKGRLWYLGVKKRF